MFVSRFYTQFECRHLDFLNGYFPNNRQRLKFFQPPSRVVNNDDDLKLSVSVMFCTVLLKSSRGSRRNEWQYKCVVLRRRVAYDRFTSRVTSTSVDVFVERNRVMRLLLIIKSAIKTDHAKLGTAVGGENGGKFARRGDGEKSARQSAIIRQKHNAPSTSATTNGNISEEPFENSANRFPESDRSTGVVSHPVCLVRAHA